MPKIEYNRAQFLLEPTLLPICSICIHSVAQTLNKIGLSLHLHSVSNPSASLIDSTLKICVESDAP